MLNNPCLNIVLVGNPNVGKSSLFNLLTGMNQKIGNYSGVTVEKHSGFIDLHTKSTAQLIDLPGIYSLFPRSIDEAISVDTLLNKSDKEFPQVAVVVIDANHLRRGLLLATQALDIGLPVIVVLTMVDELKRKGEFIDTLKLSQFLHNCPVFPINARTGEGVSALKLCLSEGKFSTSSKSYITHNIPLGIFPHQETYTELEQLCIVSRYHDMPYLPASARMHLAAHIKNIPIKASHLQAQDIVNRYKCIDQHVNEIYQQTPKTHLRQSWLIDKYVLHPIWGFAFLILVMLIGFQCIFSLAELPMQCIEYAMGLLQNKLSQILPDVWFANLLIEGILAGITGIIIFVPQIMLMFAFITILEESGYMARISYLSDALMRKVGLNGKSLVPIMSGMGCAVPAILATRNIPNQRERWLTLFVVPLMSCSARLPVYTLLISLFIPATKFLGLINFQALTLLFLYLFGWIATLLVALMLHWFLPKTNNTIFLLDIPPYRLPRFGNIILQMIQKAKVFVLDAGKIILCVSVLLWFLSSYGPQSNGKGNVPIEQSYAGFFGKAIEPVIKPLGFDWKIGIALLTSFAAREVFVGTLATIYSTDSENENLKQKLLKEKKQDGTNTYSIATIISLILFYAIAMQCISTLATTYKETLSWSLTLAQLFGFTGLAYLISFMAYNFII